MHFSELIQLSSEAVDPSWKIGGYIDVETTGLDPSREEVIELALLLFAYDPVDGRICGILDEYVGLREPSVPISPDAAAVHGLTGDIVRGKALDLERVRQMAVRAELLVAHNAQFDRSFVERLIPEVSIKTWLCSMSGIGWRRKGFVSRRLQDLLKVHGIMVERAHRAEDDVRAAVRLLTCGGQGGVSYFQELLLGTLRRHRSPAR